MDLFLEEQRMLVTCLKRLSGRSVAEVIRDQQFRYYSTIRNMFNDFEVTQIIEQAPYKAAKPVYKDNLGRIWKESMFGIIYHIPNGWNYDGIKSVISNYRAFGKDKKTRFSRKFLLDTDLPGWSGASFEMIIDRKGNRIVSGKEMETFNFGLSNDPSLITNLRSSSSGYGIAEAGLHYKFDIAPHEKYGPTHYKSFTAKHSVRIVDHSDLLERGLVKPDE